jgi:hypothetical protein
MKKSVLIKLLSTILKKRKRKPRKPKIKQAIVPTETVRQATNIINAKPIPVIPDLNRELIREFGEYKKERFIQPDERNNAPTETTLYKEFIDYKTLSPEQFKNKVSTKYNELQKVDRQKQYNKVLLEEAKQKQKEEQLLAKEEETFNKKMARIKIAIPRNLKEQKAIRPAVTIEDKIIPMSKNINEIIVEQAQEPPIEVVETHLPNLGFTLDDNDGLQSGNIEIASDNFIIQQPEEEIIREQPLIKRGRGGVRVGAGRPKKLLQQGKNN